MPVLNMPYVTSYKCSAVTVYLSWALLYVFCSLSPNLTAKSTTSKSMFSSLNTMQQFRQENIYIVLLHNMAHDLSPVWTLQIKKQKKTLLHPFNGLFSRTTWVSRYQKSKPFCILLKQETVSGSGISWAICNLHLNPASPATQPTVSKHGRH